MKVFCKQKANNERKLQLFEVIEKGKAQVSDYVTAAIVAQIAFVSR